MIIPVIDALSGKFIPVQIELGDLQMTFSDWAKTACIFLEIAQKDSITPIVAAEVRESKTHGVYIKYLAENPNGQNLKSWEEKWQEIISKTYHYTPPGAFGAVSENLFGGNLNEDDLCREQANAGNG